MPVDLIINQKPSSVQPGRTLFDLAEELGIRVPTSCHKQGKCRECLVEVTKGMEHLSDPAPEELHLQGDFRLSCRCRIVSSSGLVQCHTLRRGSMRIETKSLIGHEPMTRLDLHPAVHREGDRVMYGEEEIDQSTGPLHGIAMDLGTTTIVLRLMDLETGALVFETGFENPQRFGGSDVMARIHYDGTHPGRLLQRTLLGYLRQTLDECPVDPRSIYEWVVAGNSTMRDLFFGLNVHSIGQNPYQSITEIEFHEGLRDSTSLSVESKKLSLPIHPRARIVGLPIISGHVGADAAACMLAVNLMEEDGLIAIMDIGTNTELILGNRQRVMAASCPAGPAFEGGKISCGMPGLSGAIESVSMEPAGTFRLRVIDDQRPEGICGSGLVELLGELLSKGKMNRLGRLEEDRDRVVLYRDDLGSVFVTEGDINELAQAKGANVAGLQILFERYGVRFDDVDRFYLAGGFGGHLDLESAKRIGLIPDLPDAKIFKIGNASIEGATQALLSMPKRRTLESLVKQVHHCRLETHERFFDYFVEGCQFHPIESTALQGF